MSATGELLTAVVIALSWAAVAFLAADAGATNAPSATATATEAETASLRITVLPFGWSGRVSAVAVGGLSGVTGQMTTRCTMATRPTITMTARRAGAGRRRPKRAPS